MAESGPTIPIIVEPTGVAPGHGELGGVSNYRSRPYSTSGLQGPSGIDARIRRQKVPFATSTGTLDQTLATAPEGGEIR
mgnify:FL=1